MGTLWPPSTSTGCRTWCHSTDYTTGLDQYGLWGGGVTIDPGISFQPYRPCDQLERGPGAFPSSFTTGGADPQTSGLTYTIANPNPNDPPISVKSGYQFPVGRTVVTATATDGSGNTSTATFDVTVLSQKVSQETTAIARPRPLPPPCMVSR